MDINEEWLTGRKYIYMIEYLNVCRYRARNLRKLSTLTSLAQAATDTLSACKDLSCEFTAS
jgi:hypothetical protein